MSFSKITLARHIISTNLPYLTSVLPGDTPDSLNSSTSFNNDNFGHIFFVDIKSSIYTILQMKNEHRQLIGIYYKQMNLFSDKLVS